MVFDENLRRLMRECFPPAPEEKTSVRRWRPAIDVYRTTEGWLVKVELAGVPRDQIQVSVSGNSLLISGRRRDSIFVESQEQHVLEIAYAEFERRIELPCDLEQAKIITESRNGMLVIRISTEATES